VGVCGGVVMCGCMWWVVICVFRNSGVVLSFKMVDPVLFVFESHVLYSRDL